MSGLWRRLTHNLGLKLVSLVLALFLWAWRSSEGNPVQERRVGPLPAKAVNLAKGLVIVGEPPPVTVTLKGPQLTLDRLQAQGSIEPTVDCTSVERPSWPSLPISVSTPESVVVMQIVPTNWEVEVDTFEVDTRPVRPDLGRAVPPEDYVYEPPQLSHTQAQVSGPRKLVSRIAALLAQVDLSGRVVDYSGQARLVPVDAGGEPVSGVTCEPRVVTVTVHVAKLEQSRMIDVVARFDGRREDVPAGYLVIPSEVTVSGTAGGLEQLGAFISTLPVAVAELAATRSVTVALAAPAGVTAVPARVKVVLAAAADGAR